MESAAGSDASWGELLEPCTVDGVSIVKVAAHRGSWD